MTLEPDNWAAENDEADALIQAGKHEEATLVLEQLAESQPGFADTYLRLGEVYTKLEKHDEAISNLIRAVELHPDYLEASSKLAALLRGVVYALVIAFLIGYVLGTLIGRQLERPTRYIGAQFSGQAVAASDLARPPSQIRESETRILVTSHHEEQV